MSISAVGFALVLVAVLFCSVLRQGNQAKSITIAGLPNSL